MTKGFHTIIGNIVYLVKQIPKYGTTRFYRMGELEFESKTKKPLTQEQKDILAGALLKKLNNRYGNRNYHN